MEINSNTQATHSNYKSIIKQDIEQEPSVFANLLNKSKSFDNELEKTSNESQKEIASSNTTQYIGELNFKHQQAKLPRSEQLLHQGFQYGISHAQDLSIDRMMKDGDNEWLIQAMSATHGNKYDDAPEFEAFVNKWMAKGETEDEALGRASAYIHIGLLDYGRQKAILPGFLPFEDIKQHGMWSIDNPPFKEALLMTLDGLDYKGALGLSGIFVERGQGHSHFKRNLKDYGLELANIEKTKEKEAKANGLEYEKPEFSFTGDINLRNDNSSEAQRYNKFIFDTLIDYFKEPTSSFETDDDIIKILNDNLKLSVDKYSKKI